MLNVRRTVTGGKRKGNPIEIVELAKTSASRRQVPLSPRALAAIDALPPRLDTPLLFPAPDGGPIRLDNFRRRVWRPAVEAAGIDTPARIYDLRSTFASNAIAAGIDAFELARVMGTSSEMIEHHDGTLLSGAAAGSVAARRVRGRAGRGPRAVRGVAPRTFGPLLGQSKSGGRVGSGLAVGRALQDSNLRPHPPEGCALSS